MPDSIAFTPSYYALTAAPAPVRPALAGDVECDVCVVGGGIAGCSAALHLAERGYRVVLLEDKRIGWGASGRSGGQLLPGYACGQEKLVKLVGADAARALWDLSVESIALARQLIDRHGIACDWVSGALQAAIKPRHRAELLREQDELERAGYRGVRFIDRPELETLLATRRYIAGLYDSSAGHLHPLNYTLGLAAAAERLGVRIFENTRAVHFETGTRVTVHTVIPAQPGIQIMTASPRSRETLDSRLHGNDGVGTVRCRHLVLCGNVYVDGLAPALARKIIGVGTYLIATEPLGEARARELIANNMAVADMNWILDYFRRSADHRLLFGGRVTYSGLDPLSTVAVTRARLLNVFPQLADVRIEHSWGGYVDITLNRAPHFGRLSPDVYFLQGFSGHGIALASLAGKLVAEAIRGTAERFDVFARIPHRDYPGGALLRRPALVLAMLYYRLRDLL